MLCFLDFADPSPSCANPVAGASFAILSPKGARERGHTPPPARERGITPQETSNAKRERATAGALGPEPYRTWLRDYRLRTTGEGSRETRPFGLRHRAATGRLAPCRHTVRTGSACLVRAPKFPLPMSFGAAALAAGAFSLENATDKSASPGRQAEARSEALTAPTPVARGYITDMVHFVKHVTTENETVRNSPKSDIRFESDEKSVIYRRSDGA